MASAAVLSLAGCTDYRSFTWNDRIAWEVARGGATDSDIQAMARSLARDAASTGPVRAMTTNGRYVVMPGDTALGIAGSFGLTLSQLASMNGLVAPYGIHVGQVLFLEPPPAAPTLYVVRRGDTTLGVAGRYGLSLSQVAALNPGLDPSRIRVGQKLRLSGSRAPATQVARAPAPRSAQQGAIRQVALAPLPSARRAEAERLAATAAPPSLSGKGFLWPVEGPVLAAFGVQDKGTRNDGIDIGAAAGSVVRASENGIVVYAGEDIPAMGRMLMLRHDSGFLTAYGHNQTLLVAVGDTVSRGQPVAKVGSTGQADRPQLHFELRQGKQPVNPTAHLPRLDRRFASAD